MITWMEQFCSGSLFQGVVSTATYTRKPVPRVQIGSIPRTCRSKAYQLCQSPVSPPHIEYLDIEGGAFIESTSRSGGPSMRRVPKMDAGIPYHRGTIDHKNKVCRYGIKGLFDRLMNLLRHLSYILYSKFRRQNYLAGEYNSGSFCCSPYGSAAC